MALVGWVSPSTSKVRSSRPGNEGNVEKMNVFDLIDSSERALLVEILERKAPDLLEMLREGKVLSPGERERMYDEIEEDLVLSLTKDYDMTPRFYAIESLLQRLRKHIPRQTERLVIWGWKKGDPIHRGMDRYRERGEEESPEG
jgi:hypothetical protein